MKNLVGLFVVSVGAAVAVSVSCAPVTEAPCKTWSDCQTLDRADDLRPCNTGAALHVDTACVNATCYAECARACTPGSGCLDGPGQVCDATTGSCTKNPIACASAADCPTEKPGTGEWTCDSGACRFPGFKYAFE